MGVLPRQVPLSACAPPSCSCCRSDCRPGSKLVRLFAAVNDAAPEDGAETRASNGVSEDGGAPDTGLAGASAAAGSGRVLRAARTSPSTVHGYRRVLVFWCFGAPALAPDTDMGDANSFNRRKFLKVCATAGAAVAANPSLFAQPAGALAPGERVRLVDAAGNSLDPDAMPVGQSHVFHYPYVTTPCFLINLGTTAEPGDQLTTAEGDSYRWTGGVGSQQSIVAFSAICAHRMSYPNRAVSFIDYRHEPINGDGTGSEWWQRGRVIYCCSEGSVYDPGDGARVLAGPAPQPLAAIRLEFDAASKALYATGVYGGDMLERFLTQFGFQVALAHRIDDVWTLAKDVAVVLPMSEYSGNGAC